MHVYEGKDDAFHGQQDLNVPSLAHDDNFGWVYVEDAKKNESGDVVCFEIRIVTPEGQLLPMQTRTPETIRCAAMRDGPAPSIAADTLESTKSVSPPVTPTKSVISDSQEVSPTTDIEGRVNSTASKVQSPLAPRLTFIFESLDLKSKKYRRTCRILGLGRKCSRWGCTSKENGLYTFAGCDTANLDLGVVKATLEDTTVVAPGVSWTVDNKNVCVLNIFKTGSYEPYYAAACPVEYIAKVQEIAVEHVFKVLLQDLILNCEMPAEIDTFFYGSMQAKIKCFNGKIKGKPHTMETRPELLSTKKRLEMEQILQLQREQEAKEKMEEEQRLLAAEKVREAEEQIKAMAAARKKEERAKKKEAARATKTAVDKEVKRVKRKLDAKIADLEIQLKKAKKNECRINRHVEVLERDLALDKKATEATKAKEKQLRGKLAAMEKQLRGELAAMEKLHKAEKAKKVTDAKKITDKLDSAVDAVKALAKKASDVVDRTPLSALAYRQNYQPSPQLYGGHHKRVIYHPQPYVRAPTPVPVRIYSPDSPPTPMPVSPRAEATGTAVTAYVRPPTPMPPTSTGGFKYMYHPSQLHFM
jgi:hypothetical protein